MTALCRNFPRLSENCRKRLAIENDDKANMYSVKDLLTLNARIEVPITFDFHHHVSCLPRHYSVACPIHVQSAGGKLPTCGRLMQAWHST